MTDATFTTADVGERDRLAYWREAICEAYVRLGCEAPRRQPFFGRIRLSRAGSAGMSVVTSTAQHVVRRPQDMARSRDDCMLVSLQRKGTGRVVQGGREAFLRPGDFAFYSSSERYELIFREPFEQLVVQVPKSAVVGRIPVAEMLTAIPVRSLGAAGSLVGRDLARLAEGVRADADATVSQERVIDLVCGGFGAILPSRLRDMRSHELLTALRIESFIVSNLARADLDRALVAAAMGMSVRRINEILAATGSSVSARIRTARLERIRRDLSDPALARMSIGEIAAKWGFSDVAHVSRLFSRAFGMSPRQYRQTALPRHKLVLAD